MVKVAPDYAAPDNFPAVEGTNVTSLDKGFLEAKVRLRRAFWRNRCNAKDEHAALACRHTK